MLYPSLRPKDDPLAADFRNFLYVVFKYLRPHHPGPTEMQYEMAYFLQHGWEGYGDEHNDHGRTDIIMCFRGAGKSEILASFCLWRLYRNPRDEKIMVTSATSTKAKKFVQQCKYILSGMDELTDIRPRPNQRNSVEMFDVNGASQTQSPSLQAQGITGQVTGDRASLVVNDDVEVYENSRTEERRHTLLEKANEFENIKYPADPDNDIPGGDVIYLGTPQSEESIYVKKAKEHGYRIWCWPARVPSELGHYIIETETGWRQNIIAPPLRQKMDEDDWVAGTPTDTRFNDQTLIERESRGRLNWLLQFMLDTSVADDERYPLKLRDLIVFDAHPEQAPRVLQWGRDSDGRNRRHDIPNHGFTGDFWIGPLFQSKAEDWTKYDIKIVHVDTSGRGDDETVWTVLAVLNGLVFVLYQEGQTGADARKEAESRGLDMDGYDLRMEKIAKCAYQYSVDRVVVETNFADGLWAKAFQPVMAKCWPSSLNSDGSGCTVEEVRVSGQKELRILTTLEPAFLNHRVVVAEKVARDPKLGYQITRLTHERGCLLHDDRIDSLAGGVEFLQDALAQDINAAAQEQRDALMDAELEAFIESAKGQGVRNRARRRPGDDPLNPERFTYSM